MTLLGQGFQEVIHEPNLKFLWNRAASCFFITINIFKIIGEVGYGLIKYTICMKFYRKMSYRTTGIAVLLLNYSYKGKENALDGSNYKDIKLLDQVIKVTEL